MTMKATGFSETSVHIYQTTGVTYLRTFIVIGNAVRTSSYIVIVQFSDPFWYLGVF